MREALPSLEDVLIGARFVAKLPRFLRHPLGMEEAGAILRHRLQHREADFLRLARRAIYDHPRSPYRQLLTWAGCEYGDLDGLVRRDGLDAALGTLLRQGVYLTVNEFKGRQPVVRGGFRMAVSPQGLRNPAAGFELPIHSGGSRGPGSIVPMDLAFARERGVNKALDLHARGGLGWRLAVWMVPGGSAMVHVLRPFPVHVPPDDPAPIARWIVDALAAGQTPHVFTFTTSAVRLCQFASAAGLDLRGARFTLNGEPVTAPRLAAVQKTGAVGIPRYGSVECGGISYGCLAPEAPDDTHLLHDCLAVVQPDAAARTMPMPSRALFVSAIRPTAPLVLLNVSLGDEAVVTSRPCGCPLERLGWRTHLHTVQSHEKLTAGGMTFLDTDVIRVLEEVLPARFGGAPTDYQLVEQAGEDGQPGLRLLVRPQVGPVDPEAVARIFLGAISAGGGAEAVMGQFWAQARLLRVERRAPLTTESGKILHLHQARPSP